MCKANHSFLQATIQPPQIANRLQTNQPSSRRLRQSTLPKSAKRTTEGLRPCAQMPSSHKPRNTLPKKKNTHLKAATKPKIPSPKPYLPGHMGLISENQPGMMLDKFARAVDGAGAALCRAISDAAFPATSPSIAIIAPTPTPTLPPPPPPLLSLKPLSNPSQHVTILGYEERGFCPRRLASLPLSGCERREGRGGGMAAPCCKSLS